MYHPLSGGLSAMGTTLVAIATSICAMGAASAVTFTVDSTLDQPDTLTIPGTCHTAANTCTLRAAIMQANRSSGIGPASTRNTAGIESYIQGLQ